MSADWSIFKSGNWNPFNTSRTGKMTSFSSLVLWGQQTFVELKHKLIYWTTDHGVVKLPTRTRLQIHQKLHCHAVTLCSFYTTQETLSNSSVGYNLNTDISSSSMAAGAALSNDTQPQGMPWEGVNPLLFPGWKPLKSAISRHQLEQALFLLGRSYKENKDSEKQISLCWRWPRLFSSALQERNRPVKLAVCIKIAPELH